MRWVIFSTLVSCRTASRKWSTSIRLPSVFQLQPQSLAFSSGFALLLLVPLGQSGKPAIVDLARHKEHVPFLIPRRQPIQLPLFPRPAVFSDFCEAAYHGLDKIALVLVGKSGQPPHLVQHDLLQKVQPDVVRSRAFAKPEIVVLTAKELDVMVALIEVGIREMRFLFQFRRVSMKTPKYTETSFRFIEALFSWVSPDRICFTMRIASSALSRSWRSPLKYASVRASSNFLAADSLTI